MSYYDPYTGTELDVDTSDALVAMIQQRSLCKSEQNGYGCCVGVHVKKMKASICAKLTNGNDPKLEITANGKTIFSHSAKGKLFYSCFSFLYTCISNGKFS